MYVCMCIYIYIVYVHIWPLDVSFLGPAPALGPNPSGPCGIISLRPGALVALCHDEDLQQRLVPAPELRCGFGDV